MLKNRVTTTLVWLGVSTFALVLAPSVDAAPATVDEFNSALQTAIDDSGVFAAGTSLTDSYTTMKEGGEPERIEVSIVNPDGSLIERSGYVDDVAETRCVRFDRCWRYHEDAFPSRRWRIIPAGEAVHYETYSAEDFDGPVSSDNASDVFDIANSPGVGSVFTWTRTYGSPAEGRPLETSVDTWVVNGSSLTESRSMTMEGVLGLYSRRTLASASERTAVTIPMQNALPEFRSVYVSVHINGCAQLPAGADCR
jgi:hypothetical protein